MCSILRDIYRIEYNILLNCALGEHVVLGTTPDKVGILRALDAEVFTNNTIPYTNNTKTAIIHDLTSKTEPLFLKLPWFKHIA